MLPLPLRAKCAALMETVQCCSAKTAVGAPLGGVDDDFAVL
jgi:hypothetical protein